MDGQRTLIFPWQPATPIPVIVEREGHDVLGRPLAWVTLADKSDPSVSATESFPVDEEWLA